MVHYMKSCVKQETPPIGQNVQTKTTSLEHRKHYDPSIINM